MQQRGRRVAPVQAERTVVLLNVSSPKFFAVEVERLQEPRARHYPNGLAIRNRRRRRHILLSHLDVAARKRPFPQHRALIAIDGPKLQIVTLSNIEEDAFPPYDRRRAAPGWHRQFPRDVLLLIPFQR